MVYGENARRSGSITITVTEGKLHGKHILQDRILGILYTVLKYRTQSVSA